MPTDAEISAHYERLVAEGWRPVLTTRQVATVIGRPVSTVQQLVRDGKLTPMEALRQGRGYQYACTEVARYLATEMPSPPPPPPHPAPSGQVVQSILSDRPIPPGHYVDPEHGPFTVTKDGSVIDDDC